MGGRAAAMLEGGWRRWVEEESPVSEARSDAAELLEPPLGTIGRGLRQEATGDDHDNGPGDAVAAVSVVEAADDTVTFLSTFEEASVAAGVAVVIVLVAEAVCATGEATVTEGAAGTLAGVLVADVGKDAIGAAGGALTAFDALATTRLYPTSDSRVGRLVGYTNSIATAVMTDDAHRGGED
eukprot:gene2871-3504_t